MKHFRTRNSIVLFFGIALLIIVAIASTSCVKNDAQLSVDNLYPHASVVVEVDDVGDCVYVSETWEHSKLPATKSFRFNIAEALL